MDAKHLSYLTNAFITYGVARDGPLYKLANKLKARGKLDSNKQIDVAATGFSSRRLFHAYAEKLVKTKLAAWQGDILVYIGE